MCHFVILSNLQYNKVCDYCATFGLNYNRPPYREVCDYGVTLAQLVTRYGINDASSKIGMFQF